MKRLPGEGYWASAYGQKKFTCGRTPDTLLRPLLPDDLHGERAAAADSKVCPEGRASAFCQRFFGMAPKVFGEVPKVKKT